MPLYPYVCEMCQVQFERLVSHSVPAVSVECPECGSAKTTKRFSVPAKATVRPDFPTAAGACGVGPPCGAVGCRRISPP
jgi:putative FmdB family regulatory protein